MSYDKPYAGLKVVDASLGIAGPHCAMLLGLYGAEVVKIEPLEGDWVRPLGNTYGEHSAHSLAFSRAKASLALDLKAPEGRRIAETLAKDCDVFLQSFRPGVAERLGLGYDAVRADNPRVIYLSVSGFGREGPYAERPCTDTVMQAFSGLMSVNLGADGLPHKVGATLADAITGLYAFQAVAPALAAREGAAEGRHIDVSLMAAMAAVMAPKVIEQHVDGGPPAAMNPPAGSYRTSDGWIVVTLVKEDQYRRMTEVLAAPELAADPRYASFASRAEHADALIAAIAEILARESSDYWLDKFRAADLLANRVNGFGDWLADAHVQATGAAPLVDQPGVGPMPVVRIPGQPPVDAADPKQTAPAIGEHSRDVLAGLGYDAAAIAGLIADGVVGAPADEKKEARETSHG